MYANLYTEFDEYLIRKCYNQNMVVWLCKLSQVHTSSKNVFVSSEFLIHFVRYLIFARSYNNKKNKMCVYCVKPFLIAIIFVAIVVVAAAERNVYKYQEKFVYTLNSIPSFG